MLCTRICRHFQSLMLKAIWRVLGTTPSWISGAASTSFPGVEVFAWNCCGSWYGHPLGSRQFPFFSIRFWILSYGAETLEIFLKTCYLCLKAVKNSLKYSVRACVIWRGCVHQKFSNTRWTWWPWDSWQLFSWGLGSLKRMRCTRICQHSKFLF